MAIDYDDMMQSGADGLVSRYDEKDAMLYALGVGFMRDPLNEAELPFVYEGGALKMVPTFASAALPSTRYCRRNVNWCRTNAFSTFSTRARARARC
jgi:hypothetical protein